MFDFFFEKNGKKNQSKILIQDSQITLVFSASFSFI